jgi:hypothetical protein
MSKRCTFRSVDVSGFQGIELANDLISLTVVPEIGGKIVSIYNLTSEREWLSLNPHLQLQSPHYDGAFIAAYDSGGLDECFPSITRDAYPTEPWQSILIPDHGELWCQPWDFKLDTATADRVVLSMGCYGVRLPYRFERRLTLTAKSATVDLDYRVANLTPFDMPFVWSIHPILQIEAGMHLSLPDNVETVRIDSTTDGGVGDAGGECSWPLAAHKDLSPYDLSLIPSADVGRAMKIYTLPLPENRLMETWIQDKTGAHRFGFQFHSDEITHVGVWMNYGGWSGSESTPYYNLGLEPCIGGADSLVAARGLGEYGILAAKQTKHWSLKMVIG